MAKTGRTLVSCALPALLLAGCAGAFLTRAEPIVLDPGSTRKVSLSVDGPSDMPEWGELLWVELAGALSTPKVLSVVEPGPGVLQVHATVENWDYEERADVRSEPGTNGARFVPPAYLRQCTALMGVAIELSDPATGKVIALRRYLGVERGTQDLPHDRFRAPRESMRRAAGKAAAQFAEDVEAGLGKGR